jgi:hypothetical protein
MICNAQLIDLKTLMRISFPGILKWIGEVVSEFRPSILKISHILGIKCYNSEIVQAFVLKLGI